jgi:hypothetical protein
MSSESIGATKLSKELKEAQRVKGIYDVITGAMNKKNTNIQHPTPRYAP